MTKATGRGKEGSRQGQMNRWALEPWCTVGRTVLAKTCSKCGELRAASSFQKRRATTCLLCRHPNRYFTTNAVGKRTLLARTCTRCGLLLGGEHFGPTGRGWSSQCKTCTTARISLGLSERYGAQRAASDRWYREAQDITSASATRNWSEWTDSDVAILSDPEKSLLDKALELGRTYSATRHAARRRGFISKPIDPQQGQWIINFNKEESCSTHWTLPA